jgi:hypothetical protein
VVEQQLEGWVDLGFRLVGMWEGLVREELLEPLVSPLLLQVVPLLLLLRLLHLLVLLPLLQLLLEVALGFCRAV